MPAPKAFNNVILGQFVLSGVPVKVWASSQFLTITDADDVEDPLVGFGMDEDGSMIQFSYPEVEFISIQGNKVDIETYNKGMAKLHGGDEAPADAEAGAGGEEAGAEAGGEEKDKAAPEQDMSDHYMPKLKNLIKENVLGKLPSDKLMKMKWNPLAEGPATEKAQKVVDKLKAKLIKAKEDKLAAEKKELGEGHQEYTFGTGDIVNDRDPSCPHFGSKGIVIELPSQGEVRYTVTNGNNGDSYKPGDILTKPEDRLEKI